MGGLILSPFITPLHQNTAKVCLSRLLSVVVDLEVLPIKPRTYYILSLFEKKKYRFSFKQFEYISFATERALSGADYTAVERQHFEPARDSLKDQHRILIARDQAHKRRGQLSSIQHCCSIFRISNTVDVISRSRDLTANFFPTDYLLTVTAPGQRAVCMY